MRRRQLRLRQPAYDDTVMAYNLKKNERLNAIKQLVSSKVFRSVEQFVELMHANGYNVNRSTLSRDLLELGMTKMTVGDGYMYVPSGKQSRPLQPDTTPAVESQWVNGFVSIRFSGNIAVVKTRNGYAQGLAYDIDMSAPEEILGTISGADTIFAVLREGISHNEALKVFARFLPISPDTLTNNR